MRGGEQNHPQPLHSRPSPTAHSQLVLSHEEISPVYALPHRRLGAGDWGCRWRGLQDPISRHYWVVPWVRPPALALLLWENRRSIRY
uniref:Uncharacterized protein n=1 Tax=Setaria viridis TaxID=4556 RepID=A0A4V6D679_SETVI|nr:hypothetical protein SEVIR_5G092850v2 [Setaria viridis]